MIGAGTAGPRAHAAPGTAGDVDVPRGAHGQRVEFESLTVALGRHRTGSGARLWQDGDQMGAKPGP
jgi:hypothetical protein